MFFEVWGLFKKRGELLVGKILSLRKIEFIFRRRRGEGRIFMW